MGPSILSVTQNVPLKITGEIVFRFYGMLYFHDKRDRLSQRLRACFTRQTRVHSRFLSHTRHPIWTMNEI